MRNECKIIMKVSVLCLTVVAFVKFRLSVLTDVGRLNGRFLGLGTCFVEACDIEARFDESAHNLLSHRALAVRDKAR